MRPITATASLLACLSFVFGHNGSLPVVNLGYEQHQAITYDDSARTYNFSNIRFAEPPVGDLRFRAPVPVWQRANSSTVNNGSTGVVCPAAVPLWSVVTAAFVPAYLTGQSFNETAYFEQLDMNPNALEDAQPKDSRMTEDCLFLDVIAPKEIFEGKGKDKAAVLVWIYGGGYAEGEKTGYGDYAPYGLFERSQAVAGEKFIFVALNYRLGAFGWLPGATLQKDGTANAALYDQRTGLEWVQKYIHLFGGDRGRVTVMGESAGGGSIMHQITAFGGNVSLPFAQAIPQSPAWLNIPGEDEQETIFQGFLDYANVSTIQEARSLSTEDLQRANIMQIGSSSYGSFTYGPVVDGIFATKLPGQVLLEDKFRNSSLKIMVGHNGDEGLMFTQPNTTTDAAYKALVHQNFPTISNETADYLTNALYPAVYDGSYGYTDDFQRAVLTVSDSTFTCNTYYLDTGFANRTFSYEFNVPPALHGADVSYSFACNDSAEASPNVAVALQEYIASFVVTGSPNGGKKLPGVPYFPVYGANNTVTVLDSNITYARDFLAGPRCDWWQRAYYA